MWNSRPSAIKAVPTSTRNDSASIFSVGCSVIKRPMALANTIMKPTAITTAITITSMWSAMPTAVITESSENTMSRIAI